MTMKKAFSNILILTFLVLLPFVQSSGSNRFIYGANMATRRPLATNTQVGIIGNEAGVSVGVVEDSARRVPTGPDPLHHNNNPTIDP